VTTGTHRKSSSAASAAQSKLADLVTLAERQRRAILSGDLEAAQTLIQKKEKLAREIVKLREGQNSLSDRGVWSGEKAKQLLERYLALESESVTLLSAERDAVRHKREKVGKGRKALRGYRTPGGGGPRFCDRQA